MPGLFFDSVLTCPVCGQQQVRRIPYNEQLNSFYCKGCECKITVQVISVVFFVHLVHINVWSTKAGRN